MSKSEVLLSFHHLHPVPLFHIFYSAAERLVYLICLGVLAVQFSLLPREISENFQKVMQTTKLNNSAVGSEEFRVPSETTKFKFTYLQCFMIKV